MLKAERLAFFRNLSLLSSLTPSEIEALESMSSEKRFEKGAFLFQEGDPADGLLIIKQGYVKAMKQAFNGKNIVIRLISPNEMVGEVAVFGGIPYPVSAQALIHTIVYKISREQMVLCTKKYSDIMIKLIGVCVQRLAESYSTIDFLGTKGLEERLALSLLRLANNFRKNRETEIILDMPLNRQDLAEIVGGTYESVCRIMANLKRKGIIRLLNKRIIISDLEALKLVAKVNK